MEWQDVRSRKGPVRDAAELRRIVGGSPNQPVALNIPHAKDSGRLMGDGDGTRR